MSGNGNHGIVNGAMLGTDRHDQANRAYSFDGVDDYIDMGDKSEFDGRSSQSIIFWIKFASFGGNTNSTFAPIITKWRGDASIGSSIFIIDQGASLRGTFSNGSIGGGDSAIHGVSLNRWAQFGVVFKDGNLKLYSNGIKLSEKSLSISNITNASESLKIGGWYHTYDSTYASFDGSIDEIRIYDRTLSAEEVSALYRLESPNHFVEMNSTVNLEMIWAEPGTFTMGSPTSESGRNSDENSHNVTLSKGFYLGKYEVTQAQYETVMTGVTGDLNATPSNWSGNPNRPVDSVSYEDIQVFLVRLNVLESNKTQNGWAYVLPTEAQWEYACRAGTSTRYSWGNLISATDANWDHGADPDRPVDVGSFSPNAFGFHDMHGNVYEWVADWYGVYPNSSLTDPLGLQNGSQKVIRGGAYGNGVVANLRAAFRYKNSTSLRANGLGFRLAYLQVTHPPSNLSSNAQLTISENHPIGTVVGEFNATDPDANATLTYQLVSGAGDGNNSLFTLDQNGTLKTEVTFDYETNASFYSIRVQAKDEFNATVDGNFTVFLMDDIADNQFDPMNGLVAWWKLDDGNGVIALDSSVNEYNGSLINGPVWGQGKIGGALQFDGLNDHVLLPNPVLENRNNQGTISLWFNAPSANSTGYLFNAVGTSQPDNRYYIRFNSGLNGTLGNPAYDFPANTIQPNTWHFSTMVWRNSTSDASFYVDGQLSSHSDSNYQLHSHIGKANLGSHMGVNGWFAGLIDEVRIYNRALSTSEVAALYQLENTPPDLNATVTGTVQYNGMIPGPAYVWALDANGTKVAEQILADGNGSYSLNVPKGAGYDFKVFIDGTGDGNPQAYEVWKHIGDWNSSLGGFNLTQVDGNLSGINFNLFDSDYDSDGFTNWQEYQAGTNQNDANSTPGLNFGLVAWYPFDGNASDMSGNGNHGTVNGATLGTDRFGITGQAYSFDGVDDFIEVQNSNELKFLDQYSILVWVKAPNFQRRYNHIITKMAGSISSFEIYGGYQSGGTGLTLVHNRSLASYHMQYSSSLPDNTWHHFGLTYANGILKRFDDGVSSASYNGWPKVEPQESSLYIGRGTISTSAGTEFMQGCIDNVRIYNRALSATEVQSLYQLESTPQDQNATVTGTVQYNGMIPGPAYVWALDANGTKVAEQILADGNGNYSLNVPKGIGYDFKVFIDGTGDGNPQAYEVWKHIGDWNSSLGGFNLTQVDGNLSGINFNLFDSDYDSDGFTNWQEYQAGTNQNDANSTPGLNFGLVAWYPFDGNASDMSSNGNHGTVNGATLGTDRHGQTGMAYDFDGVNDKIIVNGTWPSGNSSRSVSVWYKAPSHNGNIFTFGNGLLQKARFSVGLNFNNIHGSLGFIGQGSDQIFSVNGLYDSWNMILLTYDGLLGNLYLNGGILSESFNYILETNGSMPLIIGSNSLNRNDEFFLGSIDQVHIYDRALSAFEVQTLYQMEKPKIAFTNANFQQAVNLWFSDVENATATYGHIRDWNVSGVTNMFDAFKDRTTFNEDISGWDVSNVTNMSHMFNRASSFNQSIGDWNVSSVMSMGYMFRDASSFNSPIGNWNTSFVTNMSLMFEGATSFNQALNDWNISSVSMLNYMFSETTSFNQDISNWDTSSVSNFNGMFSNTTAFNQDISDWNTSSATLLNYMFKNALSFNQDISDWNIAANASVTGMFDDTPSLSNLNKGQIHNTFSSITNWPNEWGIYANASPVELNASTPLTIAEEQLLGSLVGTFSVVDPDVNASILFELVDGNGSDSNHEFSLDQNGTLRTAVVFDYEGENSDNDPTLNIRVRARDEYNASVERSFMVTIMDVNESTAQIPVDKNESVEHNFTSPISNQPIDGNDTAEDSNVTLPIIQVYRPIPETLGFVADSNNTYLIRGRILTDGGSPILESGVFVSDDILFRGEMIRLSSNNSDVSPEFSVMVSKLAPGMTYYYRAFAINKMGETLGARKRLKTPEKIDPNMWFADMPKMGGGWRSSNWFGPFQQFPKVDWIYHSELGWAYIASYQKEGLWLWQKGKGWMWTQKGVWPHLYRHQTAGWLYLLKSINGNPVFYDYTVGSYSTTP
jgi:surface protein